MDKTKATREINGLLPSRPIDLNIQEAERQNAIKDSVVAREKKQTARELAELKLREKKRLESLEAKRPEGRTAFQHERIKEQEAKIELLETIEAEETNLARVARNTLSKTRAGAEILQMQGTTRPEITRLLTELNINLSVQLTKNDTANLLACLLTCNETQLNALANNNKVPVVIKTVIKRLQEDVKLGNIATIEHLWDRIFGKNGMAQEAPDAQQLQAGIIPSMPVSREAYVIIRDTLL